MSDVVIRAERLSKQYRLGSQAPSYGRLTESITNFFTSSLHVRRRPTERELLWALRDLSLEVREGEVVGLIGRNGSGKTTLLKVLARITEPTSGRAELRGRVGSLLEVGTGFHPELSGRENVFLNGAILGMRKAEITRKFDEIVAFAELERFIDTPVKRYSSGMYVRLAFAVAAHLEPEIMFIDEVLAVGDQAFQQRCLGRIDDISKSGRTVVFVSHNLASVSALCTRGVLLQQGSLVAEGPVDDVIQQYLDSIAAESDAAAGDSLRDRPRRFGDGRARFTGITVESADGGAPRAGEDVEIALEYEAAGPLDRVTAIVWVRGPISEPLFWLANEVTGEALDGLPARGVIRCTIPKLPLLQGRYGLTLRLEVNGILADVVEDGVHFTVFENDVFGSGHLPPTNTGHVVVQHSWSVEPAS